MLATVASINSANRLRQHLAAHNIPAKVIQTPSQLTREGCGYSLRFDDKHKSAVAQSAKKLNINVRSFFREDKSTATPTYIKE